MCFIWSVLRGRIIWVNLPLRHSFHLSLCFLFAQAAASLFFTSRELTWLFQGFSIISRCWTKYNIEDTIIFKSFYTFCSVLGSKSSSFTFRLHTLLNSQQFFLLSLPMSPTSMAQFSAFCVPLWDLTEFSSMKALFWTCSQCGFLSGEVENPSHPCCLPQLCKYSWKLASGQCRL